MLKLLQPNSGFVIEFLERCNRLVGELTRNFVLALPDMAQSDCPIRYGAEFRSFLRTTARKARPIMGRLNGLSGDRG